MLINLKTNQYITLDIDVLDPAYANGTGTEPGGKLNELIIHGTLKDLNIVGFDIVEVSSFTIYQTDSYFAAKIIRM